MKRSFLNWVVTPAIAFSICAGSVPTLTLAADEKESEVKRKEAEIQKLKQQLEEAQKEIKLLRKDLKQNQPRSSTMSGQKAAELQPLKPIGTLPPLKADEVVSSVDLVRYFAEDPSGAAARFEGQTIRVRGVVDKFEAKMFQRVYEVLLESPERTILLDCRYDYEERFNAVHPIEDGQTLLGRINERASVRLMKIGDTITVQGKCHGLKGRRLQLTGCKTVSQ